MKPKLSFPLLLLLLFILFALSSHLAFSKHEEEQDEEDVTDPELETCKHLCKAQQQYSEKDKRICVQRCDKYHEMKKKREKEKERDVEKNGTHHHRDEEDEEKGEDEENENPYVFEKDKHFETISAEEGTISVLEKFTKRSNLLRGIENFRLSLIQTRSHSFVTPCHFDCEIVLFNVRGQAIIGLVMEDKTERVNLEAIVNTDWNDRLFILMFHIPISTPGNFEEFFGPGGRDPESILTAFSREVLEAALKTPSKKLDKLFDQQNEGCIITISGEEVQALSRKKSFWPFGSQSITPFNLFSKNPSFSNQYGSLIEVGPFDKKSGLEGLNVMLTLTKIIKGSMSTILYNTHATKIAVVIDGNGKFEMACPHLSSKSHSQSKHHQKTSPSYHKISADLNPGTVFVVPAGKDNIVVVLDKTAKELAFNYPAEKADEVFNRKEQFFSPFEVQSEESGHADA